MRPVQRLALRGLGITQDQPKVGALGWQQAPTEVKQVIRAVYPPSAWGPTPDGKGIFRQSLNPN